MSQATMVASATKSTSPTARKIAILAGVIGNVLEWYDFAVYIFIVPILSKLFFPTNSPANALLLALAVFGSGFVMRPAGAILFGIWGDRYGRRSALAAVMVLMGTSTFLIGCLPTHSSVGLAAPALLVGLRLLQGLSSGGEWGGSAAYVVEYAPNNRRGFYGSWQIAGVAGGILLGSVVVSRISAFMGPAAMTEWSWRIPFWLGLVVTVVGFLIRLQIAETPRYVQAESTGETTRQPLKSAVTDGLGSIITVFGITAHQAITSWVLLTYMVTYLLTVVKLPFASALSINSIGLVTLIIVTPLFGYLSDIFGRKPFLIIGAVLIFFGAIPAFMAINRGSYETALIAHCAMIVAFSIYIGPFSAALVELFPTRMRYTGLSLSYNLAQAILGGFAPFIAQYLVNVTGSNLAPTWYVMAGALVAGITLLRTPETANSPLA
jgi:MHS family proline/betaine transporter-like MFS transporter